MEETLEEIEAAIAGCRGVPPEELLCRRRALLCRMAAEEDRRDKRLRKVHVWNYGIPPMPRRTNDW